MVFLTISEVWNKDIFLMKLIDFLNSHVNQNNKLTVDRQFKSQIKKKRKHDHIFFTKSIDLTQYFRCH